MNLKNNKGYVAIDASIAVLVILIIIPTLAGMIYNVNKTNNLLDRKTEAISIAVNTIETAKGIDFEDLSEEKVLTDLQKNIYTNLDTENKILTKDENTYKITVTIQDYATTDEGKAINAIEETVKTVDVTVTFKSGKKEEKIELSTVISFN